MHKENQLVLPYFLSSLCALGPSVVVLSLGTWVSLGERKKKKQCCTWQAIIAPLQMYHQWNGWRGRACPATHINTHTPRQGIVSLPRESKCWVFTSKQTLQLRTLEAPVSALHAQETKNGGGHHNCRPNLRCGVQWWWLGASLTLGDTCWTHFISCSFEMNGSVMWKGTQQTDEGPFQTALSTCISNLWVDCGQHGCLLDTIGLI